MSDVIEASAADRLIDKLRDEVNSLGNVIREQKEKISALETSLAEAEDDDGDGDDFGNSTEDAINAFCDLVERPVGKLRFVLPQSDAANRAILGLFDAIGRNP